MKHAMPLQQRWQSESGAVLVMTAQASAVLIGLFILVVHLFNSLTTWLEVRRIAERVAETMVDGINDKAFDSCATADAQFQILAESGGRWIASFGSFAPATGFSPASECGTADPVGNAVEISLEVGDDPGMFGVLPRLLQNQLLVRQVKVLGYVQDGKGYIQIL